MAKKTGSKQIVLCAHCLKESEIRSLIPIDIEMHKGHPHHGYYTTFVCEKCEPKFQLDRRKPTK